MGCAPEVSRAAGPASGAGTRPLNSAPPPASVALHDTPVRGTSAATPPPTYLMPSSQAGPGDHVVLAAGAASSTRWSRATSHGTSEPGGTDGPFGSIPGSVFS